jgi:uncharacterized tellurite resistance protein B-like protein
MSLLDLFTSGEHKKAKTYFAALVKLAFADGVLEPSELKFLQKMAIKLGIEDAEFSKILKDPDHYPLDSPLDYNDRIEQLYHFTAMIFASHEVTKEEELVIEKLAVGLGFPVKNAKNVTHRAVELLHNKANFETFSREIKEVNGLH